MKGVRGEWVLMRVFIGEGDRLHGRALSEQLVEEARRQGLAGATVLRGIMGFGANSVMHTTRLLRMSEDLPIVVEIVDAPERIELLHEALHLGIQERLHSSLRPHDPATRA